MNREVRTAVLVTSTEPEPRRFGKQVVLGGFLDHLVNRLGPESVHLVLVGREWPGRPTTAYVQHLIEKPPAAQQALSVARHTGLPSLPGRTSPRLALQEAVLRSRRVEDALARLLAGLDADLEIFDTVRLGQYAPRLPRRTGVRRLLYADDLFSERYAEMLARPLGAGNAGGEFQQLLPSFARQVLSLPGAQRLLLRMEQRLVAAAEERQPQDFDGTYLISDAEAARLAERCAAQRPRPLIESLPPLLREPKSLVPSASVRLDRTRAPEFTFIGAFSYAPNREGLDWFLGTCRDEVRRVLPDVVVNVVGAGTEAGLDTARPWGDQVRFLGWVDDLDAVLGRSVALLSPLRGGTGIKIKVLEALSRGLPVVATPAGVQGVTAPRRPAAAGAAGATGTAAATGTTHATAASGDGGVEDHSAVGCLIGADPAALAGAMARAWDPVVNAELSAAARDAWAGRYSRAVVEQRYDAVFGLSR